MFVVAQLLYPEDSLRVIERLAGTLLQTDIAKGIYSAMGMKPVHVRGKSHEFRFVWQDALVGRSAMKVMLSEFVSRDDKPLTGRLTGTPSGKNAGSASDKAFPRRRTGGYSGISSRALLCQGAGRLSETWIILLPIFLEDVSMIAADPVKTQIRGGILEVTIDRPKANAVDLATSRLMGEVFRNFRDDPSLRVAILTGAGEKFFCPGWDLKAAADGDAVDGDYGVGGFGGLQELPHLNKPVIAAVNGICCGGGLEIALSCDIILASTDASFALPEINSGTVADAASIKLPKRIPYHVAMEMLLTGRWLDVEEAQRWGFVNHVYPAQSLLDEAWKMAELLASGPPLVYAAIKEIVRDAEDSKFQDSLNRITQRQLQTVDTLYGSEDAAEGARAFSEKRDPVWKGI